MITSNISLLLSPVNDHNVITPCAHISSITMNDQLIIYGLHCMFVCTHISMTMPLKVFLKAYLMNVINKAKVSWFLEWQVNRCKGLNHCWKKRRDLFFFFLPPDNRFFLFFIFEQTTLGKICLSWMCHSKNQLTMALNTIFQWLKWNPHQHVFWLRQNFHTWTSNSQQGQWPKTRTPLSSIMG